MSQHITTVRVRNPSADAKLTVSMQGQLPQKMARFWDWIHDRPIGAIQPRSPGSIGGGAFRWHNRIVLAADRPTTLEVVSRFANVIVEELELIDYSDVGPTWEAKSPALGTARVGAKYVLDANTRIALRIDPKEESLDDVYVNFFNAGDAIVRMVDQTERECFRVSRAAAWTAPVVAGEVPPGGVREYTLNDASRIVVTTASEVEVPLEVVNSNPMHQLRLITLDDSGSDLSAVNVDKSGGAGVGHSTGRVVIRQGRGAAVQQSPL
jgi:hypothetical protein